jgi:hypothetical protein
VFQQVFSFYGRGGIFVRCGFLPGQRSCKGVDIFFGDIEALEGIGTFSCGEFFVFQHLQVEEGIQFQEFIGQVFPPVFVRR